MNSIKEKIPRPPKIAAWILKHTAVTTEEASLLGDLEEEYRIRAKKSTPLITTLWYWSQILESIPPFVKTSFYWSTEMIKNYLKIAWRNIQKHSVFSFINITGLAIGMVCCIMILLWVKDELSFDTFHTNRENIYRVVADWKKIATQMRARKTGCILLLFIRTSIYQKSNTSRYTSLA